MQQALDEEEFEPICAAAEKALKMSNTELRQKAVEALGWFGEKALVELTPFMADPDEDVSEAAVNAWVLAVSEIESPVEKMKVARLVLNTSASKDALFMVGGEYSNSASEYIDDAEDEETATQRRIEVLQPIVDMMENSRSANVAAAKEIYEDITGNEWRGFDEAELYLADPDNYELPEDREETLTPMPSETPVPETPTPETPTPEMPEPDEPDSETPGPIQP
jgi:hypothetical protein